MSLDTQHIVKHKVTKIKNDKCTAWCSGDTEYTIMSLHTQQIVKHKVTNHNMINALRDVVEILNIQS